ncbi:T9SS type A sorting domain-containing protein, partial [Fulvivirga sp.]
VAFDFEASDTHEVVIVTSDNDGLTFEKAFDVVIIDIADQILGLNEISKEIVVYPNPTKGYVTISWNAYHSASVVDINGKLINTFESNILDLTTLKNGVYYINLKGLNDEQFVIRILKE